ncbi:hypothetical protein BGZ65_005825 [Modicella reniformis]|uniref:Uncharacterized protein n=1 Tax=Modicella reniformis TaxID=1440133 RepID=A0A9P6MKX7_9FUNG|nr:hypothetical protein BGZ65_005825 [Modicella reniformis]
MPSHIIPLSILAGALLNSWASSTPSTDLPPEYIKRENVVYVTRTEFRYVQVPAAATPAAVLQNVPPSVQAVNYQPAPLQPPAPVPVQSAVPPLAFSPPPPIHIGVPDMGPVPVITPLPAVSPAPPVPAFVSAPVTAPVTAPASTIEFDPPSAAWQPPPNNALTYTSYAGLLTTAAPAFYPPSSALSMANTIPVPVVVATPAYTSIYTPVSAISPVLWPSPTSLVEKVPSRFSAASLPPATTTTAVEHTSISLASTSSDNEDLSSSVSETTESTEASKTTKATAKTTTTLTEMTVSTTTTTRGDTTHTTTTVGSDGTTTVLTQYPTLSRTRGPQNTSGAQAISSRVHLSRPTNESVLEYLIDVLTSHPKFVMTLIGMMGAMLLPGVMFVMV